MQFLMHYKYCFRPLGPFGRLCRFGPFLAVKQTKKRHEFLDEIIFLMLGALTFAIGLLQFSTIYRTIEFSE